MIARTLALAAGLTGAAGLSQFPEFTQQYVQRLGGAVDELARSVREFDEDAAELGFERGEALRQLATGGAFGEARAESMGATVARYERLSADLAALEGKGAFERVALASHMADPEIADRTWQAFRPGIPVTAEGAGFAGAGLLGGWILASVLLSALAMPFRRIRRESPAPARRREPVLHREPPVSSGSTLRAVRGNVPSRWR